MRLILNLSAVSLLASALAGAAFAAAIPVPNGDFSEPSNDGRIGGGLLNPNGSALIGSGPWAGTYNGVAGVLAPPTLSIGGGRAAIAGIAGVNVLSLLDNGGYFSQTLSGVTYQPDTTYTLSSQIDAGGLLALNVLSGSGVGIALTAGNNIVSSSATAPDALLSLTLLSGTNYELTLKYTTSASAPSGALGIRLFDTPTGLATADLLSGAAFSHVSLDATPTATTTPEPSSSLLGAVGLLACGWIFRRRRNSVKI